jgi:hypothetical protein
MTALLDRVPNDQPAISGAAETRHPGDPDRPLTAKKRIAKDRIAKDRIEFQKLQKRLRRHVGEAVQDSPDDRGRRSGRGLSLGRQGLLSPCSTSS